MLVGLLTLIASNGLAHAAGDPANYGLPSADVPSWAVGKPVHFLPSPAVHAQLARASGGSGGEGKGPLVYHIGEVQHNPTLHVIFWGKPWSSNFNTEETSILLEGFYAGISESRWQGIVTQYYDHIGRISSAVSVNYYFDDETSVEHINDGAIRAEIEKAVRATGWATGPNAQFIVLTDGTYESGFAEKEGKLAFCGYHNVLEKTATITTPSSYAFVPYQGGGRFEQCGGPEGSEEARHHTVKTASHEYAESATDPYLNAWYDTEGYEVGDICNGSMVFVEGLGFVQPLWDNYQNQCSLEDANPPNPPAPIATTGSPSNILPTSAIISGTVNPDGVPTAHYHFQYGKTNSYGSSTPEGTVGYGTSEVPESASLSGLAQGTVYHYRIVATSWAGTEYGKDKTFTTSAEQMIPYNTKGHLQETWWNGSKWLSGAPSGAPEITSKPAVIFNKAGEQLIVYSSKGALEQTWWNGSKWLSAAIPTAPEITGDPAVVLNRVGEQLIYYNSKGHLEQTWWNGTSWSSGEPTGAVEITGDPAVVFNEVGEQLIVYSSKGVLEQTWWNGSKWLSAAIPTAPEITSDPSVVISSTGEEIIEYASKGHLEQTWYNGSKWASGAPTGAPEVTGNPAAVINAVGEQLIDYSSKGVLEQTWWNGSKWLSAAIPTAPEITGDPVVMFNIEGEQLIDYRSKGALEETWYNGSQWSSGAIPESPEITGGLAVAFA